MTEIYRKPALTFEQQLQQLIDRGLVVQDHNYAIAQLSTISYYRLSAYWYPFRARDSLGNVTDNFNYGANFNVIIKLYEFDRRLRLLVIDAIERIEVYIRTLITYHLGHTYGAFGHIKKQNFHPKFRHEEWIRKLEDNAERSSDAFIEHYKNKYAGFPSLPIWIITEIISLGSLSVCYKGLKHEDKEQISRELGLHYKRLGDWLHKLTYIRNVCAHHSRLWNRELALRPEASNEPNWNPPITPRNDRIFFILLMLRYLLRATQNGDDWARQCDTLLEPIVSEEHWRDAMGIPENWRDHPIWT